MSTPWIYVRQIEVREDGKTVDTIPIGTLWRCKCFECWIPKEKLIGREKSELWLVDYDCGILDAENPPDKVEVRMRINAEECNGHVVLVDYDAPDDFMMMTVP